MTEAAAAEEAAALADSAAEIRAAAARPAVGRGWMERLLVVLVNRLIREFGDSLVSVILYGSAAAGDHHSRYSDLNVLCVLSKLTPAELEKSGPIFRWWRELGNPAPLLMTEDEVRSSADCFPIEFSDMREYRKVLHGKDVIAELQIDQRYYRAQLEHDLRAQMLRLRQQAAGALKDRDELLKLCLESVSTFCVLGRHALLLAGRAAPMDKREVVRALGAALEADMDSFRSLLDIREGKAAPQEGDPVTLFGKYLARIEQLIHYVDRL
jgi:predicted nucleotidyltransferase